jgi:hypothetical protein
MSDDLLRLLMTLADESQALTALVMVKLQLAARRASRSKTDPAPPESSLSPLDTPTRRRRRSTLP